MSSACIPIVWLWIMRATAENAVLQVPSFKFKNLFRPSDSELKMHADDSILAPLMANGRREKILWACIWTHELEDLVWVPGGTVIHAPHELRTACHQTFAIMNLKARINPPVGTSRSQGRIRWLSANDEGSHFFLEEFDFKIRDNPS